MGADSRIMNGPQMEEVRVQLRDLGMMLLETGDITDNQFYTTMGRYTEQWVVWCGARARLTVQGYITEKEW